MRDKIGKQEAEEPDNNWEIKTILLLRGFEFSAD